VPSFHQVTDKQIIQIESNALNHTVQVKTIRHEETNKTLHAMFSAIKSVLCRCCIHGIKSSIKQFNLSNKTNDEIYYMHDACHSTVVTTVLMILLYHL